MNRPRAATDTSFRGPTRTVASFRIDPFAYLREALPGLFALGEKPTTEQLLEWLPDRWLLNRTRNTSLTPAVAG